MLTMTAQKIPEDDEFLVERETTVNTIPSSLIHADDGTYGCCRGTDREFRPSKRKEGE